MQMFSTPCAFAKFKIIFGVLYFKLSEALFGKGLFSGAEQEDLELVQICFAVWSS